MAISGVSHPIFSAPLGGTNPASRAMPHDQREKDRDKSVDYFQPSNVSRDSENEQGTNEAHDTESVVGSDQEKEDKPAHSKVEEFSPEQLRVISELQARDREVRGHEAAHQAAGGGHVGGASYTFQQGPDGRQYAIGGEVSVDMSTAGSDPQSIIVKMDQIRAAALAPADPSSQDRAVAAAASAIAEQARETLRNEERTERVKTEESEKAEADQAVSEKEPANVEEKSSLGDPILELLGSADSKNQQFLSAFEAAQQAIDLLGRTDHKKEQALAAYEAAQQQPYLSGLNFVG
jgi:hypothetical protein